MNYIIQQKDIDILFQGVKNLSYKIELLNRNLKVIDVITGNLIDDSFSISAESAIRRTYNCTLYVSDSTFDIGADKKVWIDRYIRPYIGIEHIRSGEVLWYLMGTYIINEPDYNYDKENKTLSLTCSDLMCILNGDIDGKIQDYSLKIPAGSYIRNVIVSLLNEIGIKKYYVQDIGKEIPYDLEYSVDATYYDVLKDIVDLYAGYEMFFDIDGTFIIQKIPTTKNEISILDESIINPLVIKENKQNTFNKIYNVTKIWGKFLEPDYYTQTANYSNNIYSATFSGISELENFAKYAIKIPSNNQNNVRLNINGIGAKLILDDYNNPISSNRLKANMDYVFKYRRATDDFLLLGQYQAYGEYKCYDEDCPFSITNLGKEIINTMQLDELESDDLCQQRAKYETWLSTRFLDQISLEMVNIPFLDVNKKITYTNEAGETKDYIIKSISGSNSNFIINVSMMKYSELYPDIV